MEQTTIRDETRVEAADRHPSARRARARAHPRRRRRPARPARHPRPLRRRPSEAVLRARGPRAPPRPGAAARVARRAALADDACPHAETRAVLPRPRLRHPRVLARDPALQPRHGGRCPLRATAHRPPHAERPRRHPAVGPLGLRRGRLHGARGGRHRHRAGALDGDRPARRRADATRARIRLDRALRADRRGLERPARRGALRREAGPARALDLQQSGTSYWNTSVVAGQAEALLFLFAMAQPALVDAFLQAWPQARDACRGRRRWSGSTKGSRRRTSRATSWPRTRSPCRSSASAGSPGRTSATPTGCWQRSAGRPGGHTGPPPRRRASRRASAEATEARRAPRCGAILPGAARRRCRVRAPNAGRDPGSRASGDRPSSTPSRCRNAAAGSRDGDWRGECRAPRPWRTPRPDRRGIHRASRAMSGSSRCTSRGRCWRRSASRAPRSSSAPERSTSDVRTTTRARRNSASRAASAATS